MHYLLRGPLGNDPVESSSPPTITIGQNLSIDPAGAYGNPRYIWSAGGFLPDKGKDAQGNWKVPLFFDPVENVVTVQGNTATIINSNGSTTPRTEPTGQVYEGTVNGRTVSATIVPITYKGNTYFPFNLNDYPSLYGANSLNISGVAANSKSRIHATPKSGGSSPVIGLPTPPSQVTDDRGAAWGIAVLSDPVATAPGPAAQVPRRSRRLPSRGSFRRPLGEGHRSRSSWVRTRPVPGDRLSLVEGM